MSKPILVSALIVFSIFFGCQKPQTEPAADAIVNQPSTETIEPFTEAVERECELSRKCSLSIYQSSSTTGAWDLSVTVQKGSCTETEIACYRGDNLNAACQNIGASIGTFVVVPSTTYRFYYTGPLPRTFTITNGCCAVNVTFSSGSPNPVVLSSSVVDLCNCTGPCI